MMWIVTLLLALGDASMLWAHQLDPVVVFASNEGNFTSILNPSLVSLRSGSLLVFAEARLEGGGDGDESRIGLKKSDDVGTTWGAFQAFLPEGVHNTSTLGNLAAFVVPHGVGQERVCLIFCVNNTYVYIITSDDEGDHWSSARDLTPSVKQADEGWVATGPANAIVMRSGRVLVPIDTNVATGSININFQLVSGSQGRNRQCPMSKLEVGVRGSPPSPLPPLHRGGNVDPSAVPGVPEPTIDPCTTLKLSNLFKLSQRAYVLISDDAGQTWSRSSALPLVASETAVAELADGRVIAKSRLGEDGWQNGCAHFAMSLDNGSSWEAHGVNQCIEDPGVQNSLLASPAAGGVVLLASPRVEKRCGDHLRGNLTLYRSSDGGMSWDTAAVVHAECSGYSSMVGLGAENLGIVWSSATGHGPLWYRNLNIGPVQHSPAEELI